MAPTLGGKSLSREARKCEYSEGQAAESNFASFFEGVWSGAPRVAARAAKTHLLFIVRLQRRSMIKYMVQRREADW